MLACRGCRVPLSAESGCSLCDPIRKHLVVVGEDEEDRPSLAATGGEIVSALRTRLKIIKRLLKDENDPKALMQLESRLLAVANTAAKMLESARKIQTDGVQAVEQMSFSERAELFIDWVTSLTPAYRKSLRDKWDEWESQVSKPLLESKVR
jgi:hypothetical protein